MSSSRVLHDGHYGSNSLELDPQVLDPEFISKTAANSFGIIHRAIDGFLRRQVLEGIARTNALAVQHAGGVSIAKAAQIQVIAEASMNEALNLVVKSVKQLEHQSLIQAGEREVGSTFQS